MSRKYPAPEALRALVKVAEEAKASAHYSLQLKATAALEEFDKLMDREGYYDSSVAWLRQTPEIDDDQVLDDHPMICESEDGDLWIYVAHFFAHGDLPN